MAEKLCNDSMWERRQSQCLITAEEHKPKVLIYSLLCGENK